jgi:hypothetical protein
MDGGQEVETAAARCKAGMPFPEKIEKRDTQVSVETFVLNSLFLGLIKTSRHRCVNIPFTVLY